MTTDTSTHKKTSMPKNVKVYTRRVFLITMGLGALVVATFFGLKTVLLGRRVKPATYKRKSKQKSIVYLLKGGSPEENMRRLLEKLGGIEKLVGKNDIVVIKPNAQWWRQGMTNTDSMVALIETIVNIPDFSGEVIIADNHQMQEDNSRGWTTDESNGRFNLNGVVDWFANRGYKNVTKYHWHDAGPNPAPLQGDANGDAVVTGPGNGDGYVWDRKNVYVTDTNKKCLITYPIFTSSYSGVTVDMKKGAWKDGTYTDQPVKFINMSSLNSHSVYAGATAAVKNLMGVVDMSCGFPAPKPVDTYNTHHIGVRSGFLMRLKRRTSSDLLLKVVKRFGLLTDNELYDFHYTGGVLGKWMKTVHEPDLNIVTAEWIGVGGRLDSKNHARPRALIASTDAVAVDYIATKHILLPETHKMMPGSQQCQLNDPDNKEGPLHKFLVYTAMETDGAMEDAHINIVS